MGSHKLTQAHSGSHRFTRLTQAYSGSLGLPWAQAHKAHIGLLRLTQAHTGSLRLTQAHKAHMVSHGSHGLSWVHMGSHNYIGSHMLTKTITPRGTQVRWGGISEERWRTLLSPETPSPVLGQSLGARAFFIQGTQGPQLGTDVHTGRDTLVLG